jgi:hypothetical protein
LFRSFYLPGVLGLLSLAAIVPSCVAFSDDDSFATSSQALGDLPTVEVVASVTPDGNAIALTLKNTTSRSVSCKSVAFRTPIAKLDHCGEAPIFDEFLELKALHFGPAENKIWADAPTANAGSALARERLTTLADDRHAQGFGDEILEYCPVGATERRVDCGYDCNQDGTAHAYGSDDWTITAPDTSWKKYTCDADGTVRTVETRCANNLQVSQSRRVAVDAGTTRVETCQTDGSLFTNIECSAGYTPNDDRSLCVPAPCGSIPHGGEYLLRTIEHGRIVTTCLFGQPAPGQRTVCNSDYYTPVGESCPERPKRDCNGHPHGSKWNPRPSCNAGRETRIWDSCWDGHVGTSEEFLRPARTCHFNDRL